MYKVTLRMWNAVSQSVCTLQFQEICKGVHNNACVGSCVLIKFVTCYCEARYVSL